MYGLLEILEYSDNKKTAFQNLYENADIKEQFLLRSVLAQALQDCPKIIPSHGTDWFLCVLASHHKCEDDTMRILQGLMRMFDDIGFGLLTENIEWKDLNRIADESLIGISFFRKHIEEMNKRHAAPSVEYYSEAGALAFQRLGYDDIGEDFTGWTDFIEKEMAITSIIING